MNKIIFSLLLILFFSCKSDTSEKPFVEVKKETTIEIQVDFTMVFASCNDQNMEQPLWKSIIETKPDVFIWGGDNIYADTDDMDKMKADYNKIKTQADNEHDLFGTEPIQRRIVISQFSTSKDMARPFQTPIFKTNVFLGDLYNKDKR